MLLQLLPLGVKQVLPLLLLLLLLWLLLLRTALPGAAECRAGAQQHVSLPQQRQQRLLVLLQHQLLLLLLYVLTAAHGLHGVQLLLHVQLH
jgi:hypothetical protein